jgi:hypothetical protein
MAVSANKEQKAASNRTEDANETIRRLAELDGLHTRRARVC